MYVIYKENKIPSVGGVHPKGIELGLAYYNGWNLADCPEEKIHYYKEFDFIAVPKDVVDGLKILDTMVEEDDGSPEGDINFTLSDQDKENVESAKKFINNIELKLITRAKVREMTDLEDDLVNLKRVVHSLVVFAVDDWNVKTDEDKQKIKYKDLMETLTPTIAENIGALSTIEKDLEKIEEIVDLEVDIAKVVDEYYLTKKLK